MSEPTPSTQKPAESMAVARGMEIRPWWGRMLVGRRPLRTLLRIVILVTLTTVLTKWCFAPLQVTGHSMEPTFRDGRINLLNRLAYRKSPPRRGDVVAIRMEGRRMVLLKRVLGEPGDRIQVRQGQVVVNGDILEEPYARGRDIPDTKNEAILPPEKYFVIGDNRDLTEYGIVDRLEIIGKVMF